MKKVAVLHSSHLVEWQSCQTIGNNLLSAYQMMAEDKNFDVKFCKISNNNELLENVRISEKLLEWGVDRIVWIEYSPTPLNFLNILESHFVGNSNRPELVIHVYGDFVLNIADWNSMQDLLAKYSVKFIAASEKQGVLVSKLLQKGSSLVEVCPFPVNCDQFRFDGKKRELFRQKYHFENNELVILYSGRLSYQKNIFHLLYIVKDFVKLTSSDVRLVLAGPIDDLGMPYIGLSGPLGAFFGQFKMVRKNVRELFDTGKVQILGNVDQEELRGLYCASDLLVNLSTHNDEDYGMAPAEALCSGLPALLSAWGGFCSFKSLFSKFVFSIPLVIEMGRFLPSYKKGLKELMSFSALSKEQRLELSELARSKIGIESIAQQLKKVETEKFEGFSQDFVKVLAAFSSVNKGPLKDLGDN